MSMMNTQTKRDRHRRKAVDEFHGLRLMLKSVVLSETSSKEVDSGKDSVFQRMLAGLPKDTSFVRVKNRCTISGRARSVMRKYRLSRFFIRSLALKGELPGVKKASW